MPELELSLEHHQTTSELCQGLKVLSNDTINVYSIDCYRSQNQRKEFCILVFCLICDLGPKSVPQTGENFHKKLISQVKKGSGPSRIITLCQIALGPKALPFLFSRGRFNNAHYCWLATRQL